MLMPRRSGLPRFGTLGICQLLVIVALILVVLDLLNVSVRGLPLIPIAVLLLCIAWLVP